MATSFYIYENIDEYNVIYNENRKDPMREVDLLDLYVCKDKLYVVTNTSMHKEQPRMERTIIHFRNGKLDEWADGSEKLVKYGSMQFNPKTNNLEIFPKLLRKPELQFRIGRYYGEDAKKKKINYEHRFYDLFLDRINLILEEKNA